MIKFFQHAIQNIFPVIILEGFVKSSQIHSYSSFYFCCYNKHHDQSHLGRKVFLSPYRLQSIIKGNRKQRRDIAYWLLPSSYSATLLIQPRSTCPEMALFTVCWTLLHQFSINKYPPHRCAAISTLLSTSSSCWGHREWMSPEQAKVYGC